MSMTTELAQTKELAFLMSERFTMNPISCKHLNEAWREAFPDEVAVAKRMLALVEALEAAEHKSSVDWEAAATLNVENEKLKRRIAELETYSKTTIEFREAALNENRHLKLELEIAEKRIAELEARTVKLPDDVIDQVCLAASEIHNRGNGVSDDKAQFIIDRIRSYLESTSVAVEGE